MKEIITNYYCDFCKKKMDTAETVFIRIGKLDRDYGCIVDSAEFHVHKDCLEEVVNFETLEKRTADMDR